MTGARTDALLEIDRLSVGFRRRGRWRRTIHEVSLTLQPGEAIGLVGESGSGKSTVAMAALRYLPVNGRVETGSIRFQGQDLFALPRAQLRALRGDRIAAVYQHPGAALNPALSIGRQIAEVFVQHRGLDWKTAREAAAERLARLRIVDPQGMLDLYPHEISGGMQQRAVIAMALATDPALLVLDEPTTALDATVEKEILDLFADLRRDHATAFLLISHNLALVRRVTDRVHVMYAGEVVEEGPAETVFQTPRHPYTRALVDCIPTWRANKHSRRLSTIEGFPPEPGEGIGLGAGTTIGRAGTGTGATGPGGRIGRGCQFQPRCVISRPDCVTHHPALEPVEGSAFAPEAEQDVRCPFHCDANLDLGPLEEEAWYGLRASGPTTGATPQPLFDGRGIGKRFGRIRVLRDIDLAIYPGETFGLVGESGSGKSTLAQIVMGLCRPDAGELRLSGMDLAGYARQRAATVRRALQMVFQWPDTALNPSQHVGRMLARAAYRLGAYRGSARRARVSALMEAVRLPLELVDSRPARLSGGQKQRVGIARAFAGEPHLVVLDEPTSSLDVSVQAAILNLLVDLQRERGVAYLFISHDLSVVRYLADRIGVLYRGRLVEVGPAAHVFGGPCHPYTRLLLDAALGEELERELGERLAAEALAEARESDEADDPPLENLVPAEPVLPDSEVSSPAAGNELCLFLDRCPLALPACRRQPPPDRLDGRDHRILCWLPLDAMPASGSGQDR